ncbi:hypothetical protein [Ramlibacter sp.]
MSESKPAPKPPQFDDVLKRMLSSPPKQHKDEKKPEKKSPPKRA